VLVAVTADRASEVVAMVVGIVLATA
jgi:hypothetical protein